MINRTTRREPSLFVANGLPRENQMPIFAALTVVVAILLTAVGAFNTREIAPTHRFILWFIASSLIVGQSLWFQMSIQRYVDRWRSRPSIRYLTIVISVVLTLLVVTIELHGLKFTPLLPKKPDPIVEFLFFLAPSVVVVSLSTLLLQKLLAQELPRVAEENPAPIRTEASNDAVARLLNTWPADKVLKVTAQDHYLEILTDNGKTLIRGSMRGAAKRLQNVDGIQVHRSYWVARCFVARSLTKGRDYKLLLSDGSQVPVARSRIPYLRANGWLKRH